MPTEAAGSRYVGTVPTRARPELVIPLLRYRDGVPGSVERLRQTPSALELAGHLSPG
jgi:hypothetical protein